MFQGPDAAPTGKRDWPELLTFAVLRPEYFGALLFNPYLAAEAELDALEALVASLCDGTNSTARIVERVCEEFGLAPADSTVSVTHALERMRRLGVLTYRREDRDAAHSSPRLVPSDTPFLSAPKSVIWDVTYVCNLRCPHCLTSSGEGHVDELGTQDAFRLIDQLAEAKVLYLSLSGGEPFLRTDILDLLRRIADTNLRVDVATNGTVMSDELLAGLKELPVFQAQVSIDGIGRSHDLFRGRPGAFAAACETIERLRDQGIALSISTTVTRQNLDQLESIIQLAVDLGCSGYKAIPFVPAGRGIAAADQLALDVGAQCRLSQILVEASRTLQGRINIASETSFAFLFEEAPSQSSISGLMACSAGYDTLSIGADGTAYPCPFLHGFPLGHTLETPVRSIWRDSAILHQLRTIDKQDMKGACRSCNFAPFSCRGGCRAAAYLRFGDILERDPNCFRDIVAVSPERPT